jgi:hypothetical protein
LVDFGRTGLSVSLVQRFADTVSYSGKTAP